MENIKVSVKHNDWSEVFDMLVELGATHLTVKSEYGDNFGWLFVHEDTIWLGLFPHERKECREVTFQQLKDMVVLRRNDPKDANYIRQRDGKLYFVNSNKTRSYYMMDDEWTLTKWDEDQLHQQLKPIKEKEMQEFLVYYDNKWALQLLDSDTQENSYRVAVPDGMNIYWGEDGEYWFSTKVMGYRDAKMVWQRSEIESLNDQYAEIEKVRQETVKVTIDGVEAFNAIANDINVQYRFAGGEWKDYTQDLNHEGSKLKAVDFLCDLCEFRYKPKTIVVNGAEYEDEQKAVKAVKDYFK